MTAPVFRISVYDKDRVFRCQIGNPSSLTATVRHNLVSTLSMTVPLAHPKLDELIPNGDVNPGARLRVTYRGEHLISGPITGYEIKTDGATGACTISVEDDFRILREVLGWQVPTSAITAQGASEYRTYTGNAETIVKAVVNENAVTRLGVPGLSVAPNLNRGAVIPGGVPFRMHRLDDKLLPAIEDAGIGITVKQVGSGLVLDVHEPATYPRALSVKGRTLKEATLTHTRPTASRAIVGGPGDGILRNFRQVTDLGRETTYGMRAEVFRDARDAQDEDAPDIMDARGQEDLNEHGPKNGIKLTLAGTGIFQYGPGGFHVGDRLPVKITDALTVTEVIRECTLKWVSPTYAAVEPSVGDLTDQPERITAQRIAALARAKRDQEKR
ncbi:hypothetical protein [Pseudarthrobacter sp. NamE5]|uniref:Gp37-like protein n=1 Tax=Pseudarthrobacter sp. NamE5 TaxID=2576839 RepID=UPI0014875A15|nr:hypothetical protein [Pseudarthrobacter sp. NamE5]